MKAEQFGGLHCIVTGGPDGRGGGDGPVVVFMHGFGAPGDDLVPLAQLFASSPSLRFVFPEAPIALGGVYGPGRAWWPLDLERLQREQAAGRARDLSREVPAGLDTARERLMAMMDDAERRLRVAPGRTVLGGFSQGAMLACDVTLRSDRPWAALIMLSGTLLAADQWTPLMPRRRGLPVFMSHGRHDSLLAFARTEELSQHLSRAGLLVEWVPFNGDHEIPPMVLARLAAFLSRVTASKP